MVASVPELTSRTRSTGVDASDDLGGQFGLRWVSGRRRTARLPPRAARPRRRPDGRGRGSSGPRSTPGRRSGCRRRRSASSPAAEVMNRGVPPTAVKARTGELTPPGMTAHASANSCAEAVGRWAWPPVSQPAVTRQLQGVVSTALPRFLHQGRDCVPLAALVQNSAELSPASARTWGGRRRSAALSSSSRRPCPPAAGRRRSPAPALRRAPRGPRTSCRRA